MRLKAIGPCEGNQIQQFAILAYEQPRIHEYILAFPTRKLPSFSEDMPSTKLAQYNSLNHPNATCGLNATENLCITHLNSYSYRPDIIDVSPDYQFYLGFKNQRQHVKDVFKPNNYKHFMRKFNTKKTAFVD